MIDAFENDDADYIAVVNSLDIKHSTSRSIVANYFRIGRCGKLGSIFIPEKYVIRMLFVFPWTSLIPLLPFEWPPPGGKLAKRGYET